MKESKCVGWDMLRLRDKSRADIRAVGDGRAFSRSQMVKSICLPLQLFTWPIEPRESAALACPSNPLHEMWPAPSRSGHPRGQGGADCLALVVWNSRLLGSLATGVKGSVRCSNSEPSLRVYRSCFLVISLPPSLSASYLSHSRQYSPSTSTDYLTT